MLQELKCFIWAALLIGAASSASAFALYGPLDAEAWQTIGISYNEGATEDLGIDIATPRKLTEEYRWNTPILYYAFDPSFEIFGSNGIAAVDQAMAILNGLTNASSYRPLLDEVPLDTTRFNFRAAALGLVDLKSRTLSYMLEELGLGNAERWVWALRDREGPLNGAQCPAGMNYQVTKFNYDPVTFEQSSYVNGTLFSYRIIERCNTPPANLADAYEFPVDPLAPSTSVAGFSLLQAGAQSGAFYTGLTRDDVGGMRYLLRTNNFNTETVDSAAIQIGVSGNVGSFLQVISTLDLAQLAQISKTNPPAQLQALFPDLQILSFTTSFELVTSSNTVAYFTNYPYSPAGSPASLVVATVFNTTFQTNYSYVFGNVVTNSYYTNGTVIVTTTNVVPAPFGAPGQTQTQVNSKTQIRNFINGDYFVIPTNICSFEVLSNIFTQVIPASATITATNATATNILGQSYSQTTTTFFTNHLLLVRETPCPTNTTGTAAAPELRQGIEKINFIRKDYDSLLGQFWSPITTNYTIYSVVGGQAVAETFRRTTTQPDILFNVQDLADPGTGTLQFSLGARSEPRFVRAGVTNSVAGPGIIQASALITFNNLGVLLRNSGPAFVDEQSAGTYPRWGSFDGTTNAPIAYPNGTSLQNLEGQILLQITPSDLPDGTVGVQYNAQLGVIGGQSPYTFSLAPGSPGLPPGLTLSANGLISGTPQFDDTYDFVVRMTDGGQRQLDTSFSITISQ